MRFLSYLRIQIRLLILRWRWLVPLPIMVFIGYLLINALRPHLLPAFLSSEEIPMVNSWDAFFIAFGNAYYMVFVIANLFLILVCDSLPESGFGQFALFRFPSRRSWWCAKSLSMLIAAFLYTFVCMLVILFVSSLGLPFSMDWSQFSSYPANILLSSDLQAHSGPFQAALALFGLLTLGFWTLGMLIQVVALLSKRTLYGYLTALLLLVGSLGISGTFVNVPGILKLLPLIQNLISTQYPYPFREIPIFWSYGYWAISLALLGGVGLWISKRQDFLSQRH